MAMVVKNNIPAKNTLNLLNRNDKALAKDLEKVSSGMKINSAADDASGYAISDRMDVQVKSLDQDKDNTQNGQSILKTASGALQSTVDILSSLKERAIQAANDTNTDIDRATIQKELDQAIDQIDENANVQFNGMTMLDGSRNHYVVPGGVANTITNTNFSIFQEFSVNTALSDLRDKAGMALAIQSTDQIEISYFKDGQFKNTTISAYSDRWQSIVSLNDMFDFEPMHSDLNLRFDETDPTFVGTDGQGEKVYAKDAQMAVSIRSNDAGIEHQISGFCFCIKNAKGQPRTDLNKIFNDFQESIPAENQSTDNTFHFQIGTRSNQTITMAFADMRAQALGLKTGTPAQNISVGTREQANSAIQALDTALQKVLAQQTTIGSVASRMDFTGDNITTSSENTQAAQSVIRDADMAKEMTAYTKDNILAQAAQAMLAQANQNSSSVLSLLQGQ